MPLRLKTPFPGLEGATEWFNGEQPQIEEGKPIFVHFWAVSCHICHETLPEVVEYQKKYADQGLQTVGIHMPRQQSDTDVEKVKADLEKYGVDYEVAVDNKHNIAKGFENEFVPAFFIFDAEGKLKFRAAGDRGFTKVKDKIEEVLNKGT